MKKKVFLHPIWLHVPAAVIWLLGLGMFLTHLPLPARAPVHFTITGVPDGWGDPTYMTVTLLALGLGFIGLSAFLMEMWVRQESRKRYSWLHLMDEGVLSLFVGMLWVYIPAVKAGPMEQFDFPWVEVSGLAIPSILVAMLLEWIRPYRPMPTAPATPDGPVGELPEGKDWTHVERQNPVWMNGLWIAMSVGLLSLAFLLAPDWGGWTAFIGILGVAPLAMVGGLRVEVSPELVRVTFGRSGIRLFRAKPSEIEVVEAQEFSPLADFGGWGIRYGRNRTWGYFLRGTRGVLLVKRGGGRTLVGSDNAARLAALIRHAGGGR